MTTARTKVGNNKSPTLFYLQPSGKIDNTLHRRVRRLTMRDVPRAGKDYGFHRAVAFLLGDFDLLKRAILIVRALDDEDGHPHIGEFLGDFPVAKSRIEPGPAPAIECMVGIFMPLAKFCAQIRGLIGLAHACDLGDAELL